MYDNMGFWKTLLGGKEKSPEEEKQEREEKNFDLLKYDGVKAMRMGQADYAVRCFEEALKMREDLEVRDYLWQVFLRKGNLAAAIEQLQVMADAQPANVDVLLQLAHVAYMEEDYPLVEQTVERIRNVDAGNERASFLLAKAAIGTGDSERAIALLDQLIAQHDDYADARLLRGQTLLAAGRVADADADATWLVDFAGGHEDVLMLKAAVETAKQRFPVAMKLYDLVLQVNPFSAEAYRQRGNLYAAMGETDKAKADLQQALELNPEQDVENIEQQVKQAYKNASPFGV